MSSLAGNSSLFEKKILLVPGLASQEEKRGAFVSGGYLEQRKAKYGWSALETINILIVRLEHSFCMSRFMDCGETSACYIVENVSK